MTKRTPRRSKRIREKDQPFEMPSREKVLDEIEDSPSTSVDHLRPKKLINNYIVENYSYNNRGDLPALSDDSEGLEEFIDSSDELESPKKKRCQEKENATGSRKKKQRQKVRMYGSDDEDQLQEKRRSQRISRQPKKERWKYDKEKALDQIFEREPDLKEVIDSDDADSFVCEDDVEEFESLDTELGNAEENTDGIDLDDVGDSDANTNRGEVSDGLVSEATNIPGKVDKQDVPDTCEARMVHEVNSSNSASRDDTISSTKAGRWSFNKNISPVTLGKRQCHSEQSSDLDAEVIDISSAESIGACDVTCKTELTQDNIAKGSSTDTTAVSSVREERQSVDRGDSLVNVELKREDVSNNPGKSSGTQVKVEMKAENVPGSENNSLSSVKEERNASNNICAMENITGQLKLEIPEKGHIVQEKVPDDDSGVYNNGQEKKSIILGETSGHISNNSLNKTENQEGSSEVYKITTSNTDDRSECVVLSDKKTGEPGDTPVADLIEQHGNRNVERGPKVNAHSPDMDEAGSDSDSEIRTGQCLRSKLHHRKQLSKVLDSGDESDEDSESEINNSFAQRRKKEKRKSITIDSDEDD